MNDVIKEFDELCDIAIAAFGEELDITYEGGLINILEFVKKKHPGCKECFINRFKLILVSRGGSI